MSDQTSTRMVGGVILPQEEVRRLVKGIAREGGSRQLASKGAKPLQRSGVTLGLSSLSFAGWQ